LEKYEHVLHLRVLKGSFLLMILYFYHLLGHISNLKDSATQVSINPLK